MDDKTIQEMAIENRYASYWESIDGTIERVTKLEKALEKLNVEMFLLQVQLQFLAKVILEATESIKEEEND